MARRMLLSNSAMTLPSSRTMLGRTSNHFQSSFGRASQIDWFVTRMLLLLLGGASQIDSFVTHMLFLVLGGASQIDWFVTHMLFLFLGGASQIDWFVTHMLFLVLGGASQIDWFVTHMLFLVLGGASQIDWFVTHMLFLVLGGASQIDFAEEAAMLQHANGHAIAAGVVPHFVAEAPGLLVMGLAGRPITHWCDAVRTAVAALHAAQLVHLDLKPANILQDAEGKGCFFFHVFFCSRLGLLVPNGGRVPNAKWFRRFYRQASKDSD